MMGSGASWKSFLGGVVTHPLCRSTPSPKHRRRGRAVPFHRSMIPNLSCPAVTRTPPSLASAAAQLVDEQQADQYDKGGGVRIGDVVALRAAERPGALTSDGFVDLVLGPPPRPDSA